MYAQKKDDGQSRTNPFAATRGDKTRFGLSSSILIVHSTYNIYLGITRPNGYMLDYRHRIDYVELVIVKNN